MDMNEFNKLIDKLKIKSVQVIREEDDCFAVYLTHNRIEFAINKFEKVGIKARECSYGAKHRFIRVPKDTLDFSSETDWLFY